MDKKEQVLCTKIVSLVKLVWQHHGTKEATWENEELMRRQYPHPFEKEL